MRQVGLSDAEVRTSIRRQVQMVFFLPIIVALVHIAFAFPALQKIMTLFEMHNTPLFIGCVAVSALVILGFYTGVYLITARTYYHIVTSAPNPNYPNTATSPQAGKDFLSKPAALCISENAGIRTFPAKVPSYRCHDGSAYL